MPNIQSVKGCVRPSLITLSFLLWQPFLDGDGVERRSGTEVIIVDDKTSYVIAEGVSDAGPSCTRGAGVKVRVTASWDHPCDGQCLNVRSNDHVCGTSALC
eukprot:31548-Eustigmatos_ZCMA.PRE.1